MVIFWDIPSEQRSGHIYLTGIAIGAKHAALKEAIDAVEGAKVKRSMYAETQREKAEILDGIRESEWNAEMNPLVLSPQEADPLLHDFTQGFVDVALALKLWLITFSRPCRTSVSLILRNYSLTRQCQFLLRLPTGDMSQS